MLLFAEALIPWRENLKCCTRIESSVKANSLDSLVRNTQAEFSAVIIDIWKPMQKSNVNSIWLTFKLKRLSYYQIR